MKPFHGIEVPVRLADMHQTFTNAKLTRHDARSPGSSRDGNQDFTGPPMLSPDSQIERTSSRPS
jgi:hypothetical protein